VTGSFLWTFLLIENSGPPGKTIGFDWRLTNELFACVMGSLLGMIVGSLIGVIEAEFRGPFFPGKACHRIIYSSE
jgi:hypothetical protein